MRRPPLGWCLAFALSCAPNEEDPIVARVGGEVLTVEELQSQFPSGSGPLEAEARLRFVQSWVQQELLYQEALERRLDRNARVQEHIEQARRDLLVAALLDREFEDREVKITDEAVSSYYFGHQEDFKRAGEEIRAEHILLASRRDANALRQNLLQGDSFADAAREHSLDLRSAKAGGDLGFFSAAADPVLWEACQSLPAEKISTPVETERGYHIIRLLAREEAGTVRELESVRPQIVEALVLEDYRRRLEDLTLRLKGEKTWQVDEEQLAALGA